MSKVDGVLVLAPADGKLSRLGEEKRHGAHQQLCSQRNNLMIPVPPAHGLRLFSKSHVYLGGFSNYCFCAYIYLVKLFSMLAL